MQMLVFHGHWSHPRPGESGLFHLWAETSDGELQKPRGRPRTLPHPFALSPDRLAVELDKLAPLYEAQPTPVILSLPALGNLPVPSPRLIHSWETFQAVEPDALKRFRPESLALPPAGSLYWLNQLPDPSELPPGLALADDLIFWIAAARLALELLASQRYLPSLEQVDGKSFHALWRPVFDRPDDAARLALLARAMPPAARAGRPAELDDDSNPPPAHLLLESFMCAAIDAAVRQWNRPYWRPLPGDDVSAAWLNALFNIDPTIDGPYFSLTGLDRAHQKWVRQLQMSGDATFRITLRLGVPEQQQDPWPLDFMLQARDDPSLMVEARAIWESNGKELTCLDRHFNNPQERLLEALGYIARIFPPLESSLRERKPAGVLLNIQDAYTFMRQVVPLLEQSGFGLLVPPWWNRRGATLGARLRLKTESEPPSISSGLLSAKALASYQWEIVLGDSTLSREEFESLVKLKTPLVQVRGQWVALNPEQIETAINFWEKQQTSNQMGLLEAMAWGLSGEGQTGGLPVGEVIVEGWLGELLDRLKTGERLDLVGPPDGLEGQLRPYQQRGFSWLSFMQRWGIGACLADDMGLGKTIQTIALFVQERAANGHTFPACVICPTSVAGNWQREIERFAPGLSVFIHHGSDRAAGEDFLAQAQNHDVVITSYGLARRDGELLAEICWSVLVLDEAQNIKSPNAKQTQAIRRIPARFRLALTGTPVENRLSELWSIMHFLNPGFLGPQKLFRSDFSLPIERYHDQEAARRLRQLVGPFILRRLKTDKTIIQDLPEKMEMKVYCNLTEEQATLYQAVVQDSLVQLDEMGDEAGISRKGVILSVLLRLKQICNHPAQFLDDNSELAGRSGKLARLAEMMEEVLSVGDRALIFSQFSTMGEMLKRYLQQTFGREVLFLHGGTPRKQREWMVDRFQAGGRGPSIFILSLKAGGLGLNLTAANHVFHFDRWWNPAVEQQATDRAYRIGQTRNVQVLKFVSAGTLEENIDQMIESKRALAESVVSDGEGWLTELSTDELRQILTLRQ
ncbi:MAG: DEAD/DEAH box helicase [Anaerolineales bacterium]|nr:DEAD/DEAH box helicase [Anaerolineales bacterium]